MRYNLFSSTSGKLLCRFIVPLLQVLLFTPIIQGQVDQNNPAIKKLADIAAAYKSANRLSFDVNYLYSTESRPNTYLDSLSGSFKINGNRYNYKIDSTEFIGNDSINISIFNEDKIIYVNSPANIQSGNPLAMIDSVMLMNQYSSATLTTVGPLQKIAIVFNPGFMFKKVEYTITPITNLITKMVGVIESSEMYDPAVKPLFDKRNEYGILEVRFRNYGLSGFLDNVFSEGQYLIRVGNQYKPVGRYANYQIINGSVR
ncbi:MAG: hypothetical protein ABIQ31_05550 [Ferruginibacter sp.]